MSKPDNGEVPKPMPSPGIPLGSPLDEKLTTGEYAALHVEAKAEDKRRAPVSHWDLMKSNIAVIGTLCAVIGTLCAIVFGFNAFGDRVVARAESKTTDGVKGTSEALKQHVEDSRVVHAEIRDSVHELTGEMKEFRSDMKALYRAMPAKRRQARLEVDVVEPDEETLRTIPFPTVGMPARRDGGR